MAEHIGCVHAPIVERVVRGDPVGLFMEFERAADIEFVAIKMEGRHVAAEEALELPLFAENQPAHSGMDPVGPEHQREIRLGAVDERGAHVLVVSRKPVTTEPNRTATPAACARSNRMRSRSERRR